MALTPKQFYETCNLTDNPFKENPAVATHERASIWVGYEKENRRLQRVLTQARSDQLASTRFFLMYGGYGTGKSHALLWAQNLILLKQKESRSGYRTIKLWVSEDFLIVRAQGVTSSGKKVDIRLTKIKTGIDLPNGLFRFDVPSRARVIKNPMLSEE